MQGSTAVLGGMALCTMHATEGGDRGRRAGGEEAGEIEQGGKRMPEKGRVGRKRVGGGGRKET